MVWPYYGSYSPSGFVSWVVIGRLSFVTRGRDLKARQDRATVTVTRYVSIGGYVSQIKTSSALQPSPSARPTWKIVSTQLDDEAVFSESDLPDRIIQLV